MFERIVGKLIDAVVAVSQVIVKILLAITPDRTFSEEVARKITKRLPVPEGNERVVSTCCDAPIDIRKVGQELFGQCSSCGAYIGHLASRKISLLESNFEGLLLGACRERQVSISLREPEVRSVYEIYTALLHKAAPTCARSALRQFMPIEHVDKEL